MKIEYLANHLLPIVVATVVFSIIQLVPGNVEAQYYITPQFAPTFQSYNQIYNPNQPWSTAQYGQGGHLWDDRVLQKQLELTKSQRRDLIELKIEFDDQMGEMQLQMQKLSSKMYVTKEGGVTTVQQDVQKKISELQKEINTATKDFRKREKEVLLPHQADQIRRKQTAQKITQSGFTTNLVHGGFKQLSLSKEQKARLSEKKKELDKELNEMFTDFLEKSHRELLGELDSAQRDIAEEMLDDYEYKPKQAGLSLFSYEPYFMKKKTSK